MCGVVGGGGGEGECATMAESAMLVCLRLSFGSLNGSTDLSEGGDGGGAYKSAMASSWNGKVHCSSCSSNRLNSHVTICQIVRTGTQQANPTSDRSKNSLHHIFTLNGIALGILVFDLSAQSQSNSPNPLLRSILHIYPWKLDFPLSHRPQPAPSRSTELRKAASCR